MSRVQGLLCGQIHSNSYQFQALKAFDSDIYFNNYGHDQRSAYGGSNTPELTRSPYHSPRVPQMGLSATGHRRTLSSNCPPFYGGTPPPLPTPPTGLESVNSSKNPFLNMLPIKYENFPISPNRQPYPDFYERDTSAAALRSSLRRQKASKLATRSSSGGDHDQHQVGVGDPSPHSFSSSGSRVRFSPRRSSSPHTTTSPSS